jgi:hypothetical protein
MYSTHPRQETFLSTLQLFPQILQFILYSVVISLNNKKLDKLNTKKKLICTRTWKYRE